MKFAKQLEDEAVPEWRSQYLDYKQGKKKVKAVARAIKSIPERPRPHTPGSSLLDAPVFSLLRRRHNGTITSDNGELLGHVRTHSDSQVVAPNQRPSAAAESSPLQIRQASQSKRPGNQQRMTSYGSIIGSPPHYTPVAQPRRQGPPPSLELPAPAVIDHAVDENAISPTSEVPPNNTAAQLAHRGNAYEIRPPTDVPSRNPTSSTPGAPFRRMLSFAAASKERRNDTDVALEAYKEVDFRKADFFMFLDKELTKIENFYKSQEDHVNARLGELRQHLHRLRESRAREVADAAALSEDRNDATAPAGVKPHDLSSTFAWLAQAVQRHRPGHVGKTSRAMSQLGSPPLHAQPTAEPQDHEGPRDYVRRHKEEVSYRTAKKKLKLALQGYYQDLERLKTYSLMNRTAFRKITKKYTKRTGLSISYMDVSVNRAHFVTSEDLDHLLSETEDLYSRYFERGNKKIAISKLRSESRKKDYSKPAARTSALLAAGAVFAVQGLVNGAIDLFQPPAGYNPVFTSYLLQIYAGYFMMLFLAFLFTACVYWFHGQKVNYAFIFELNGRAALDWRELVEIPSWFWFILGLVMYLNFSLKVGGATMYIWWPVVLVGLAVLMLFLPAPIFFHRQRLWLASVLGRLVIASTVVMTPDPEFRDLFVGDMFCSLTYATGNVELFFCLYANRWKDPPQCNSSHSWVLGLFSAVPGFWRFAQCLKRWWIHGEIFPNLVNCGKYAATIMQYVTLSMYRMNQESTSYFVAFIVFAVINTIYCSVWDLAMDWSLGDPQHGYLRRTLIYKKWMYYPAMFVDPILRSNWIFYCFFTRDAQHSSIISFMVALSEAARRGLWVLFRLENEQARNVEALKASKDLPLPYDLSPESPETPTDEIPQLDGSTQQPNLASDLEQGQQQESHARTFLQGVQTFWRRAQTFLHGVGTAMRTAHERDHVRKTPRDEAFAQDDEDDDEESDDDD